MSPRHPRTPTRTPGHSAPLTPRAHTHALDCACGRCSADVPMEEVWGFEKRRYTRGLRPGETPPEVREGDHVWVEEGRYQGAILTLLRIEETPGLKTWYVCRLSTPPYEVRTRRVSLYRRREGA